jgi:hypothetical protein
MEVIEKKDEGVIMKEGMFYTLDAIKEHIPFLDDVSYRLLYLRFNENFLTEEEKKAEELMIQRLRTNKNNADKAILEEFEKNEANQPLEKVEPNDDN